MNEHDRKTERAVVEATALYRYYDSDEQLLYIGITRDPPRRMKQHDRGKAWWKSVSNIAIEWHATRKIAEAAEKKAIQTEHPKYNIMFGIGMKSSTTCLVWICEACRSPVADGDGYLWISYADVDRAHAASRSDRSPAVEVTSFRDIRDTRAHWHTHHGSCDLQGDADAYVIEVERLRTAAEALDWTAHLLGKTWIQATDWGRIVRRAQKQLA